MMTTTTTAESETQGGRMSALITESMRDWERRLAREAFERGDHIAASWSTVFDDGDDGCMPAGWYLIGLDRHGIPIDFPVRHEYGEFATEAEARAHGAEVDAAMQRSQYVLERVI